MQRGGGRGGGQKKNQPGDALTPVLPPLYPTTATPAPMQESSVISESIIIQKKLLKYFSVNYTVTPIKEKYKSAFSVERYSDRYNSPSSVNAHIAHRPQPNRYPAELFAKDLRLSRQSMQLFVVKRKRIIDADGKEKDKEDSDDEDGDPKSKLAKRNDAAGNVGSDEEDDDDIDEEMDVGNDYMVDHFDNGEDFNDNDALDAGGYGDGDDGHFY